MRRDLHRNKGFNESISLAYTIDKFKSHFRTLGTFETLCRDVQATRRVPKFLNQEPGHDSETEHLQKAEETEGTELADGVAAIFRYRRYGPKRPGTGKNLCKTPKWNTQFHRKISNGNMALPIQKFHFFRKFTNGTKRKIMFHLHSNRNFWNLLVNGKRPKTRQNTNLKNEELQCN